MNREIYPKVKLIISQSMKEAKSFDDVKVRPEHIVMSMLVDIIAGMGVCQPLLDQVGANLAMQIGKERAPVRGAVRRPRQAGDYSGAVRLPSGRPNRSARPLTRSATSVGRSSWARWPSPVRSPKHP